MYMYIYIYTYICDAFGVRDSFDNIYHGCFVCIRVHGLSFLIVSSYISLGSQRRQATSYAGLSVVQLVSTCCLLVKSAGCLHIWAAQATARAGLMLVSGRNAVQGCSMARAWRVFAMKKGRSEPRS